VRGDPSSHHHPTSTNRTDAEPLVATVRAATRRRAASLPEW
jgi:hypothetical protein